MNLKTNAERWLKEPASTLCKEAKEKKQYWSLAERTVEAVTPVLQKMKEGFLSEVEDIQVFVHVLYEDTSGEVLASIVMQDDNGERHPREVLHNQEAKELVAAFLCDFPDALFSIDGGLPLVLFIKQAHLKRYVTLNNMIEAAQNKWTQFAIAVPGGKKKE